MAKLAAPLNVPYSTYPNHMGVRRICIAYLVKGWGFVALKYSHPSKISWMDEVAPIKKVPLWG